MATSDISNLRILRDYLYADVALSPTVKIGVRLRTSDEGVAEALEGLHTLLRAEADAAVGDRSEKGDAGQIRHEARQELAARLRAIVRRGVSPEELDRILAPLAGNATSGGGR